MPPRLGIALKITGMPLPRGSSSHTIRRACDCSSPRDPVSLQAMRALLVVSTGIAALLTQAGCRIDSPDPGDYLLESSSTGAPEPSTSSGPPADGTTEPLDTDGTGTTTAVTDTSDTDTSDTGTSDTGGRCGDGIPEAPEECDDAGPSATCDADCTLVECGDSTHNPIAGETCDGIELGGQTCEGLGFDSGTLACDAACQLDTSGCGECGDGSVSRGEACDGFELGGQTCVTQGFDGGNLACTVACTLDTSDCYGCNDGSLDPDEDCDGIDLGGQTCVTQGFDGGNLACTGACTLDTSGCFVCGDGTTNPGESCDGLDLAGQSCGTLGFGGGTLACSADCAFDTSGCFVCGDGTANPGEACDGLDLGGQSCVSQGFSGGYLSCDGTCNLDTSGCCISGTIIDFSNPADVAGWVITDVNGTGAGWGLYTEAPQNQIAGPVPFPNAPVYGTDGNRFPPYPGGHDESSFVTTSPVEIPLQVSFQSWNVDEGSVPYDTKRIEISVDGGASWSTLVDCAVAQTQPFCTYVNDGRAADAWDSITLDTSPWSGMLGQLRFSYDTVDSCCSFERGWFIDDLSLCAAP
jgi:hypothetical protein